MGTNNEVRIGVKCSGGMGRCDMFQGTSDVCFYDHRYELLNPGEDYIYSFSTPRPDLYIDVSTINNEP